MPGQPAPTKPSRIPLSITGDKIHTETIKKELQNFKLVESYILTPTAIKNIVLTTKPNSVVEDVHVPEMKRVQGPRKTTNSVYGTDTVPLVRDGTFYYPKNVTEITKMYGTSVKKQ